jgi:hypothetical protein
MTLVRKLIAVAVAFTMVGAPPAHAGVGDLLVAPTRIVLNGSRGTEIVLSNIGDDVATYRVSLELRRMNEDGSFDDEVTPTERDKLTQDMILYAPRRVTIAPKETQTIRIAARAPQGLTDGEYRAHILFRAIPKPRPVTPRPDMKGVAFELIPVYGVTIPVIVRLGNLQAKVGIANVGLVKKDNKPAVALDLVRNGDRSVYGDLRVFKAGIKEPIAEQRGLAVYTEIGQRHLVIPVKPEHAAAANGPVTVEFVETSENGPMQMASTQAVLR